MLASKMAEVNQIYLNYLRLRGSKKLCYEILYLLCCWSIFTLSYGSHFESAQSELLLVENMTIRKALDEK